jgi:hypothetical protein
VQWLQLCLRNVLLLPLVYLGVFFGVPRQDYDRGFIEVRQQGDWSGWLLYFVNGVARQSGDALTHAERINPLLTRWREGLGGPAGKLGSFQ